MTKREAPAEDSEALNKRIRYLESVVKGQRLVILQLETELAVCKAETVRYRLLTRSNHTIIDLSSDEEETELEELSESDNEALLSDIEELFN